MKQRKESVFTITFISILVVLFLIGYFYYSQNPKKLEPPSNLITGNAIYEEPLTLEQLKEGIKLSGGWNVFKWTNELSEPIPAEQALLSLEDNYFYVYDYADRKFFFNPYQKLADYKNQGYYANRTFDKLEPGKKYAVYMIKNNVILRYETPEIEKETEELREEKSLFNNIWFWIIFVVILVLFYKKRILKK